MKREKRENIRPKFTRLKIQDRCEKTNALTLKQNVLQVTEQAQVMIASTGVHATVLQ